MRVFLGIDQGSSGTKGVVLSEDGFIHLERSIKVTYSIREGVVVEQDPESLVTSVTKILSESLEECRQKKFEVAGIGLSVQRSGVLAWNPENLRPVSPLISWADRSTEEELKRAHSNSDLVRQRTSLPVLSHYAAGKFSRLAKMFDVKSAAIGTLDTYLLSRLTGRRDAVTEDGMASRTMLYSIGKHSWDPDLCSLVDVPMSRLPAIKPSLSDFGFYHGIPIRSSMGDQQASLLGRIRPGYEGVINMGTISSVVIPCGEMPVMEPGFLSGVWFSSLKNDAPKFLHCLEAVTNASGAVIETISSKCQIAFQADKFADLFRSVSGADTPVVYAPLGGTATPTWRYDVSSLTSGWDGLYDSKLALGLIDNLAFFIARNLLLLREIGLISGRDFLVSGGLSEIDYLVQTVADVSDLRLHRVMSKESSARGAALGAMMSERTDAGIYSLNRDPIERSFERKGNFSSSRFSAWRDLEDQALNGSVKNGARITL